MPNPESTQERYPLTFSDNLERLGAVGAITGSIAFTGGGVATAMPENGQLVRGAPTELERGPYGDPHTFRECFQLSKPKINYHVSYKVVEGYYTSGAAIGGKVKYSIQEAQELPDDCPGNSSARMRVTLNGKKFTMDLKLPDDSSSRRSEAEATEDWQFACPKKLDFDGEWNSKYKQTGIPAAKAGGVVDKHKYDKINC